MRPTIYWQAMDNGSLPSAQDDLLWNKEPDSNNTTHVGTKFVGDATNASVGIDLGAMTNLQTGADFPILITHSATEPITNNQFYFIVSTNDRGTATGFANDDDSNQTGLEKDFDEIRAWGDGKLQASDSSATNSASDLYGMRIQYWQATDPVAMATGAMDELANSMMLDNTGKWKGSVGTDGDSPSGEEAWIEPFSDYTSNDCAALKLSLKIPDIDAAGLRSIQLVLRTTYTF